MSCPKVTGLDRGDFTTHQARSILRRLGFGVHRLGYVPQPRDGDMSAWPHPYELAWHRGAMLAISLRVPQCCHQYFPYDPDDGVGKLWFLDPWSGSWASHFHLTPNCTDEEFSVRQRGPRQLWDEVRAAHAWWIEQGRPDDQDWLFTVHPDHQTINLTARDPDHVAS